MELYRISGRNLISTQKIPSGAVILQRKALIRGPFFHSLPVCLACNKILKAGESQPCGACGWPLCSENCEKLQNHTAECKLTAERGSKISISNFGIVNPNYQFVVLLRSLFLKIEQFEEWRKLLELQTHQVQNDLAAASFVKRLFKLDWSEDEIEKIQQVLTTYGHLLPFPQPEVALYKDAYFLEHSCKPNCYKTYTEEGDLLILADEEIPENVKLTVCLTDPLWGVEKRRKYLQETRNFNCACVRCQDPTELQTHLNSIKCPTESCSGLVYPSSFLQEPKIWTCNSCDKIYSNESVHHLLEQIGAELDKDNSLLLKKFLQKNAKLLSYNHFHILDAKITLSCFLASENYELLSAFDLELLLKISEDLEWICRKIGSERRFLGLILYRIAKARIEMTRRNEDAEELEETLEDSKSLMVEAQALLQKEPTFLPEGRVFLQIGLELSLIDNLLSKL